MAVSPIPEGYHTVTPYLVVEGVDRLLDFLRRAFDAEVSCRVEAAEGGGAVHAAARIGDSMVMIGEARDGSAPMPTMLHIYVPDADAVYRQAIDAGATSFMEPADQAYGDRGGGVRDDHGNIWWIATHREDVSDEEISRRMAKG